MTLFYLLLISLNPRRRWRAQLPGPGEESGAGACELASVEDSRPAPRCETETWPLGLHGGTALSVVTPQPPCQTSLLMWTWPLLCDQREHEPCTKPCCLPAQAVSRQEGREILKRGVAGQEATPSLWLIFLVSGGGWSWVRWVKGAGGSWKQN